MKKESSIGIVPLEDRVLLKEVKESETQKTKSGIILPGSGDQDAGVKRGKVIAVGEGRYSDGKIVPMKLQVGDTVIYSWGDKIKINGEEYVILREAEISAVIK